MSKNPNKWFQPFFIKKRKERISHRAHPNGIKVRLRRYKKPINGYSFGVEVKKKGKWELIDVFKTENKACLEIAKQLNLLDLMCDLS